MLADGKICSCSLRLKRTPKRFWRENLHGTVRPLGPRGGEGLGEGRPEGVGKPGEGIQGGEDLEKRRGYEAERAVSRTGGVKQDGEKEEAHAWLSSIQGKVPVLRSWT